MLSSNHLLRTSALALALAALPLAGRAAETRFATVQLTGTDGSPVGSATLRQWPAGVLISVELFGLNPGEHGIHIHETGGCAPDFVAAGGHFAPAGQGHGFTGPNRPHAGDLPNIFVSVDGVAAAHFLNDRIALDDGPSTLFDEDGAALIVHANADTYGEKAGAGDRVACGVIKPGL